MLIQKSTSNSKGLDDPLLNRDIILLTKKYFERDAYIDILANIPILLYTIFKGFPSSTEEVMEYDDYWLFWLCMSLKTLRIFHIDEVIDVMSRIIDKAGDIFYLHRYFFENLLNWCLAAFKFLFCVHYFSCAWIMIMNMKMIRGQSFIPIIETELHGMTGQYVEAMYFITTTITTVGFGDWKGYYDDEGDWTVEMLFCIFVTIFGIVLFSSVTNEIFSYKSLLTVEMISSQKLNDLEDYLNNISRIRKHKAIHQEKIDECRESLDYTIKSSTCFMF